MNEPSVSEITRRAGRMGSMFFPRSLSFAYQTQRLLCACPFGGGEVTEVSYAAERIVEDDHESWHRGWYWLGDIARRDGEEALAADHPVTARDRFFCAASYYRSAEFYLVPEDPRRMATWQAMVDVFTKAGELWDPSFEWISWPYERDSSLGGYFVKPDGISGRRPTVIYLNGADGTKEESWFLGGRPLVDRGVNFVGVEGPGQGEPLRKHQMYTRPDYEAAISPLVDHLSQRPDVDPDRIGIVGISMGGYYAGRVACYEPRLRCVALHGACFNVHDDLFEYYPPIRRNMGWITGTFDEERARERLLEFDLGPHLSNIKQPIYVSHGADDPIVDPDAARKTFEALSADDRRLHVWTSGERGIGGGIHSSLDNPTQAFPEIVDWVIDELAAA